MYSTTALEGKTRCHHTPQELDDRPRLAVLVSCQSAGTGEAESASQDSGVLAGLGSRLAGRDLTPEERQVYLK